MDEKREEAVHLKADVKFIRKIVDFLSPLVNESKFNLNSKGLSIRVVDPAHVAMAELGIPTQYFTEYRCNSEHEMGIDLDKMAVMLKCWSGEVELDRFAKEDNLLYAKNIDEYGTHYRKMGTIDTAAMPDSKVPSLDMPAKFNIHVKPIIKFTKQAETVSDHLSITAGPKGIQFFAEGDIDTVEFIPGSLDKYAINKEYRSLFSTDYFSNLIVTMKLFFDMVEIQLGTDNPIRVNGMGKIKAMYLLAPRIESENRVNVSSRY